LCDKCSIKRANRFERLVSSGFELTRKRVQRRSMRFMPVKTAAQQDVQATHRLRAQLIKWRTGLANEIRWLPGEYGIVLRKGMAPLRQAFPRS
jgi:transposase